MISSKTETFLDETKISEALFQFASIGILVTDILGEIQLANNFLLKQFGAIIHLIKENFHGAVTIRPILLLFLK